MSVESTNTSRLSSRESLYYLLKPEKYLAGGITRRTLLKLRYNVRRKLGDTNGYIVKK